MDSRFEQLSLWIKKVYSENNQTLVADWQCVPVSGDASFRRYFRLINGETHLIAVDAPPEHENSQPFIDVVEAWLPLGVKVPQCVASDLEQGFMLLEDFGDRQLLPALTNDSVTGYYEQAREQLLLLQPCEQTGGQPLPAYDEALLGREYDLMAEWFFDKLLGLNLTPDEQAAEANVRSFLISSALEQPQVCVHRDFHARNLMLLDNGDMGVIDFQDAVIGPITYDWASITKDCYIRWPESMRDQWLADYQQSLVAIERLDSTVSFEQFKRWYDFIGLQRHCKVLGIFARLYLRDGKQGYLPDLPRVLDYALEVTAAYPELADFDRLLRERALPALSRHPLIPSV